MAANLGEHSQLTKSLLAKYPNLVVLRPTPQVVVLHTIIRDVETSRNDFVFYADRLIRLLIEEGLCLVPFGRRTVTTPTGDKFEGLEFTSKLAGVSIMRAGESMEGPLRDVAKMVRIGKILIQRDETSASKEAKLFYCKLPTDVAQRWVMLLDPMIATGGSAIKAIKLLLDHGVAEERIIFLNIIACPEGLDNLFTRYPNIRIVTTMIDERLNSEKFILPGLGDFGDRYFGTEH